MNSLIIVQAVILVLLLGLLVLKRGNPDWRLGVLRALAVWALLSGVYLVATLLSPAGALT